MLQPRYGMFERLILYGEKMSCTRRRTRSHYTRRTMKTLFSIFARRFFRASRLSMLCIQRPVCPHYIPKRPMREALQITLQIWWLYQRNRKPKRNSITYLVSKHCLTSNKHITTSGWRQKNIVAHLKHPTRRRPALPVYSQRTVSHFIVQWSPS